MIRLLTMGRCQHGCPEFKPEINKYEVKYPEGMRVDTEIRCEHRTRCQYLLEYLRKEAK